MISALITREEKKLYNTLICKLIQFMNMFKIENKLVVLKCRISHINNIVRMLKDAESWTAFHTYKLLHFGNRSTNRVEGSHAAIKHKVQSSSGTLKLVTDKIDQWYKKRVS